MSCCRSPRRVVLVWNILSCLLRCLRRPEGEKKGRLEEHRRTQKNTEEHRRRYRKTKNRGQKTTEEDEEEEKKSEDGGKKSTEEDYRRGARRKNRRTEKKKRRKGAGERVSSAGQSEGLGGGVLTVRWVSGTQEPGGAAAAGGATYPWVKGRYHCRAAAAL
ncbi:hypothetical protein NDU88_005543 [Pleurodeles waltl]|uniref:Uncharacterized protein n=1 Tax=Pleurodeles waltl TaxID=8319 RepID=A0AAV7TVN2_PLEWA|nr:hypothetical protein NDU88_005543 [Pleurodeles waltl]